MLVRERVLARRIEDDQRAVGDDGREFFVVDGVDLSPRPPMPTAPKSRGDVGLDDAVNVLALFGIGLLRLRLIFHVVGASWR